MQGKFNNSNYLSGFLTSTNAIYFAGFCKTYGRDKKPASPYPD